MIYKVVTSLGGLVCVLLLLSAGAVNAQERFKISGEITFVKDSDISIGIYSQEEYQKRQQPSPACFQIISLTEQQKRQSKVPFEFCDIPKGTYAILAFQDENRNGHLDFSQTGKPLEPTGTFRPSVAAPWEKIRFELVENLESVRLHIVPTD